MFCGQCGIDVEQSAFCKQCGAQCQQHNRPDPNQQVGGQQDGHQMHMQGEPKSKLAAGLFGIFLGGLGIHNFYLGFIGKAWTQLLMSVIGWILIIPAIVAGIWGLIEGIMILAGSITHDARGVPLRD